MAYFSDRIVSFPKLIIAAAVIYTGAVTFAHAADGDVGPDNSAICSRGINVVAGAFDKAIGNLKGNNAYDRGMLLVEMDSRRKEVERVLAAVREEHMMLARRGRTPAVSCEEVVQRAVAYVVGAAPAAAPVSAAPALAPGVSQAFADAHAAAMKAVRAAPVISGGLY